MINAVNTTPLALVNQRLKEAVDKEESPEKIFTIVNGASLDLSSTLVLLDLWGERPETSEAMCVAKYSIYLSTIKMMETLNLGEVLAKCPHLNKSQFTTLFAMTKNVKHLLTVPNQMCSKADFQGLYSQAAALAGKLTNETLKTIYTAAWKAVVQSGVFSAKQLALVMPEWMPPTPVVSSTTPLPSFPDYAFEGLCDGLIRNFDSKISGIAFPLITISGKQLAYFLSALEKKEVGELHLAVDPLSFKAADVQTIEAIVKQCKVTSCNLAYLPDGFVKELTERLSALGCTLTRPYAYV